jgi:hypothetical protein
MATAMVVPHSILAQLVQIGLRSGRSGKVSMQMFFDRQNALDWLMEKATQHN